MEIQNHFDKIQKYTKLSGNEIYELVRLIESRITFIINGRLLNNIFHSSVLVCPITTNVISYTNPLRVHLAKGMANLHQDCEVMIDQIKAIDSKRLIKKIGDLPQSLIQQVKDDILIIFDFN